ncbi:MAG: ATP-binding protein [Clostridia bacterium]|nr:ATP-binding protein [Clostridia bacterium]
MPSERLHTQEERTGVSPLDGLAKPMQSPEPASLRARWLRLACIGSAVQALVCAAPFVWRGDYGPGLVLAVAASLLLLFSGRIRVGDGGKAGARIDAALALLLLVYPHALQWAFGGASKGMTAVSLSVLAPMVSALTDGRTAYRWRLLLFAALAAAGGVAEFWFTPGSGLRISVLYTATVLSGWLFSVSLRQIQVDAEEALSNARRMAEVLQETQEDLGAADKVKSDFLASMSHEIRTPMHAISGMADMLLLSEQLGPTEYMQAENIKLASQNLLGLINDILDISKIEAGKLELYEERYDFPTLFHDVVSVISLRARERGLLFFTQVDPEIPKTMIGDGGRIRQVLLNLLGNAVKFTEEGSVTLIVQRLYKDNQLMLHFEVSDTGPGIPPAQLSRLFGAFEQLEATRAHNRQGTGLGLAISRRLVNLMHSELQVRSQVGVGSTFALTIAQQVVNDTPIAAVPDAREKRLLICSDQKEFCENAIEMAARLKVKAERGVPTETEGYTHMLLDLSAEAAYAWIRQPTPPGCRRALLVDPATTLTAYIRMSDRVIFHPLHIMTLSAVLNDTLAEKTPAPVQQVRECLFQTKDARVLLIDDNEVNLMVATNLLKLYGIQVDTATGGEQGVAKLQQTAYDIVFVDHIMPGMDGVDTVRAIRALGGVFASQVVLMLSANVMPESRKLFIKAGAQDMLAKPVELQKLSQLLRTYLPPEKCLETQHANTQTGYLYARLQRIGDALAPLALSRAEELLAEEHIDKVDAYLLELQDVLERLLPLSEQIAGCVYRASRHKALLTTFEQLRALLARIGEEPLSACAKLFCHSLQTGDLAFVRENIRSLSSALDRFHVALRDALSECDMSALAKPQEQRLLEELRDLLAQYQYTEAQEQITVLRAQGHTEREAYEQLHAYLQGFDYARARALVDRMLAEVPGAVGEPLPISQAAAGAAGAAAAAGKKRASAMGEEVIEAARHKREVAVPRPVLDDDALKESLKGTALSDDEIPPEYADEFAAEMARMEAAKADATGAEGHGKANATSNSEVPYA